MSINLGSWKEPAELDSPVFTMSKAEKVSKLENPTKDETMANTENFSKTKNTPDFESAPRLEKDQKEHNYPKRDIMGMISSLIGNGGFDISSLLGLIGNGKNSSMLTNLLPILLSNKKTAQESTVNTININDYKRVK